MTCSHSSITDAEPLSDNVIPSLESRKAVWKESKMVWPPNSDLEFLHWLEYCQYLRQHWANTPQSLQVMEGKIDLWKSYGRQHPAKMRQLLHSGAIGGFAFLNLVVWIDEIWEKFMENAEPIYGVKDA